MFYYLLLLHWIGDFTLQDREMAENKSSDYSVMLNHVAIICAVMIIGLIIYFRGNKFLNCMDMITCYGCFHFLQDIFIWRSYKYLLRKILKFKTGSIEKVNQYKYWESSVFYSVIGLDQMLHVATLYFLMKLFL